jgi:hypothetical protein
VPKYPTALAIAVLAASSLVALPSAALATGGTASITGGTLTMVEPATVGFSATLNGTDQTVTSAQSFDVKDQTGSGAGWNITGTSTQFTTTGAKTLPTSAVTITAAPTQACATATTCTLATTNVSYPYSLPSAAGTAPTATKLFNAAVDTGLGNQTAAATMTLAIPASTTAGSYTSTWTYSLVSAP